MASEQGVSWKSALADAVPAELAAEIDVFAKQLELKARGKINDALFAETRLRRGAYGQRYDNGQRHDGVEQRTLSFPSGELTKGPGTLWDAPGMQRIKIPFGRIDATQMEVIADLAEEYGCGVAHVTTRQDFQLHYVHIDDTPDLMRRLAAVGITTREACGNTVRNVTACAMAGVCGGAVFDVSPYAKAVSEFLLGHEDTQDFGRKMKVALSGCPGEACALARMHDIGAVAAVREERGEQQRGFTLYVGGGLGSVPQLAKPFADFVPEAELLPLLQSICRVFARHGEKKNRARARLKFLVNKLGLDELKRRVLEDRSTLPPETAWTGFLANLSNTDEVPSREGGDLPKGPHAAEFVGWNKTNVQSQAQAGYAAVTINLPLGDISSAQLRHLAVLARRFNGEHVRLTPAQNVLFRWVSNADLPAFYNSLEACGLHTPGAGTIVDITSCPGTDTCKLGIASSRGLAKELTTRLSVQGHTLGTAAKGLRIKISGCFNACGQHHIADIGFLGVSRKVGGFVVPHFQLVLGGRMADNVSSFGLAIGAVAAKRIPDAVVRIVQSYLEQRVGNEAFQAFVQRVGKSAVRDMLQDLLVVPTHAEDPSFYSDWGDPRKYSIGDLGVGECAGEVISAVDFGLQAAERITYEAQDRCDEGQPEAAIRLAFAAMAQAAKTLVRTRTNESLGDDDAVVRAFRTHLFDTKLFFDPFVGGKFAHYFFQAHGTLAPSTFSLEGASLEGASQRVQEAQHFVEACHGCYARMGQQAAAL